MTKKSIFEFAEKFGYQSPFGNWEEANNQERLARLHKGSASPLLRGSSKKRGRRKRRIAPVPLRQTVQPPNNPMPYKTLIDKVREAEQLLIAHDKDTYQDIEERIHVIRGIYYGTTWSVDYNSEGSPVRNAAFQIYTSSPTPIDPRPIIGEELYKELFGLAEAYKTAKKREGVDFGHLIIGLDTRRKYLSRETALPFHGGCTGLEATTWVGDIGGGAGMLAIKRIRKPKKRAIDMFRGSSFGGWVNLEGDVAAYLVARNVNEKDRTPLLEYKEDDYIADLLENYLLNKDGHNQWQNRGKLFLQMLGAKFDENNQITDENWKNISIFAASKIFAFSELYMANRLRQSGKSSTDNLIKASSHLMGASIEVASILLSTLYSAAVNGGVKRLYASYNPNPIPQGEPLKKYLLAKIAEETSEQIQKEGEKFLDEVEDWYEELLKKF